MNQEKATIIRNEELTAQHINAKITVEVPHKETTQEELPDELNDETVAFWSEDYQQLNRTTEGKQICKEALELLQNKCIIPNELAGIYAIEALDPQGKPYKVTKNFICNCFYYKGTKKICVHILAVKLYLKIKNWSKNV